MSDTQATRKVDFQGSTIDVVVGITQDDIVTKFEDNIAILLQSWTQTDSTAEPPVTGTDATDIGNARTMLLAAKTLRDLAQNGMLADLDYDPTTNNALGVISIDMARQIDEVLKTLKATGVDLDFNTVSNTTYSGAPVSPDEIALCNAFRRWQDLAEPGHILNVNVTTSILTALENDYVKRANDLIFDEMSDLKDRLNVTKEVLAVLTNIQDLHNKVTAPEPASDVLEYADTVGGGASNDQYHNNTELEKLAKNVFVPIDPIPTGSIDLVGHFFVSDGGLSNYVATMSIPPLTYYTQLVAQKTALKTQIDALTAQRGSADLVPDSLEDTLQKVYDNIVSVDDIDRFTNIDDPRLKGFVSSIFLNGTTLDPLDVPIDLSTVGNVVTSLGEFYNTLLNDPAQATRLTTLGITSQVDFANAFKTAVWLVDNMDQHSGDAAANSGQFQRNITTAITSATNINDEQKDELKQILFVFEEFYKSASAILQKMNDIMTKMAANISR